MIKVTDIQSEDGILLDLIDIGYSDIKFKIRGKEINGIKSIICYKNNILRELINDPCCKEPIELSSYVTECGFINLLRFFGGGTVKIDSKNVIDILTTSFCFNELTLIKSSIKYFFIYN